MNNIATKRIRGRKLEVIRKAHFAKHPMCVDCLEKGIYTLATELDHIVPLFKGGEEVESNRQGLCSDCHSKKTVVDLGYKPKVKIGPDGYPIEDK